MNNISRRGRAYEANISASYLESIQKMYMDFFKVQNQTRVLILDVSNLNFVDNKEHYDKIIDLLQKDYKKGLHYVAID